MVQPKSGVKITTRIHHASRGHMMVVIMPTYGKKKKRNPKACSICGHYLAAMPNYHIQTHLRNQSLTNVSSQDSINSNIYNNSPSTSKDQTSRTWRCTHPQGLRKEASYRKGQCLHNCTVCKRYLESLKKKVSSYKKKGQCSHACTVCCNKKFA